jgi:hypothetical protein
MLAEVLEALVRRLESLEDCVQFMTDQLAEAPAGCPVGMAAPRTLANRCLLREMHLLVSQRPVESTRCTPNAASCEGRGPGTARVAVSVRLERYPRAVGRTLDTVPTPAANWSTCVYATARRIGEGRIRPRRQAGAHHTARRAGRPFFMTITLGRGRDIQ